MAWHSTMAAISLGDGRTGRGGPQASGSEFRSSMTQMFTGEVLSLSRKSAHCCIILRRSSRWVVRL
jgi:hypothetical protein